MKAKRKSDGKAIEVYECLTCNGALFFRDKADNRLSYSVFDLDFSDPGEEAAALEGYVARDANGDLTLFRYKPLREDSLVVQGWLSVDGYLSLDDRLYPDLTWESEPKKVRIRLEEIGQ